MRSGRTIQCKQCAYDERDKKRNSKLYGEIENGNFGYLHVIKRDENSGGSGNQVKWICKCDCGNIISVSTHCLLARNQRTCGDPKCYYRNLVLSDSKTEDLSGMIFGDLLVLYRNKELENNRVGRMTYWHCKCKCGNEIDVSRAALISGQKSCCNNCSEKRFNGEETIRKILLDNNISFQSEIILDDLRGCGGGLMRFDFGVFEDNKLVRLIEFDGEQHFSDSDFWKEQNVKQNDIIKNEYCKNNNIPLVRIPYWDKETINIDSIMGKKYIIT